MDKEQQRARLSLEANFVFCLWKYPKYYGQYLKRLEKNPNFLKHKASIFFFTLGDQMFQTGYTSFDEATVLAYLDKSPSLKDQFNKYGGFDTINGFTKSLSNKNLETYYIEIMKQNCIASLAEQNLLVEGDAELLDCMTIEQMRMFYSNKINKIFYKQGSNAKVKDIEITDDDLLHFHEGKEYGLSIANTAKLLNYEIMGLNKGLTFVGGTVNTGKTAFALGVMVKSWMLNQIKGCLISNEQGLMEFKRILIAMAIWELHGDTTDVTRRRIKAGHFTKPEWEILYAAKEYINKNFHPYLKFVEMPDYNMDEVRMLIDYLSTMGYGGFVYDVFKAESNQKQVIQELKDMSNELFLTSKNCEVATVATVQLGLSFNHIRFLTMDCISTSKQIVEPATEVLLMRKMWDDEVTGGKFDIMIYDFLYDKHGQIMKDSKGEPLKKYKEVLGNEYKDIILLFISKTRNTQRDKCIAFKFHGDYNVWEELGYCTPAWEDRRKGGS